jgi:hypothetical protein
MDMSKQNKMVSLRCNNNKQGEIEWQGRYSKGSPGKSGKNVIYGLHIKSVVAMQSAEPPCNKGKKCKRLCH